MKRLLIICQKVDEGDDLLGFFASWIREFAKHHEHVTVIALGAGEADLPGNVTVYSLGKERNVSRWRRWFGLVNLLRREVPRHDSVFCHMSPVFAIAAAPFTKAWHKKLVLWYLHRSNTFRLRLALRLVDTLVTADADSLAVRDPKIHAVGHGIDIERFMPDEGGWKHRSEEPPFNIVSVGRISRIKNFETLIRAAAILRDKGIRTHVEIVGRPVMKDDAAYLRELDAIRRELDLQDIVRFAGFVPYSKIRDVYANAEIAVGCTPPGGIDKTLLEAMASICLILTSNTVMRKHLPQGNTDDYLFRFNDPHDLADKIEKLTRVDSMAGRATDLFNIVHERHNLPITIRKINELL